MTFLPQRGTSFRVESVLESPVLVLNRLWQAVNICTARRAFNLLYEGHAQAVAVDGSRNFLAHDFESWRDFSARSPEPDMLHGVSLKIRVTGLLCL